MILKAIQRHENGDIVIYTNRVNQDFVNHLRANAQYRGKGIWIYNKGQDRLLFAVGNYVGLGKKAFVKRELKRLTL